ncbi:MAG: SGNH/GDSL hydrolase family protein [Bacteroidales bacterium]|nr:SGNH/GDSL hydrolase family protein [Candidatus Sodaliphilus fimicaballi]
MIKQLRVFIFAITTMLLTLNAWAASRYVNADQFPLLGKVYEDSLPHYSRIPASLNDSLRKPLIEFGSNCAGLAVRFKSNTTSFTMRWRNLANMVMGHMTPTGIRGLDLYCWDKDHWHYVNSARPTTDSISQWSMLRNGAPEMKEYMLYLPLYDGLKTLEIGIDSLATIEQPTMDFPKRDHPVVLYGSSIMQGGCASRPGMASSNIISRRLNRECINLGFSGNAFLDMGIAHMMADVNASVYVMDNIPNSSVAQIHERTKEFVKILRDKNPNTPIVFIEDPQFPQSRYNQKTIQEVVKKNAAIKQEFAEMKKMGIKNIYYIQSKDITVLDGEASVDGIHFTDVAFNHYADVLTPLLGKLIKNK